MEEKKRTTDTIREEYSNLCAKAGHLQYQIYTFNKDLDLLNQNLRDLNIEAGRLAQEAAKAPEEPKS